MPKTNPIPSVEVLRSRFFYDPDTGELWSRATGYPIVAHQLLIHRRWYLKSRVIWKMATGEDPAELIDHANGEPVDNRLDNVREATHAQNSQNRKVRCDNVSGLKGAHYRKARPDCRERWLATIWVNKKQIHLGTFQTAEDAHEAYKAAALKYFGPFART